MGLSLKNIDTRLPTAESQKLAHEVAVTLGLSEKCSSADLGLVALCCDILAITAFENKVIGYEENQEVQYVLFNKKTRRSGTKNKAKQEIIDSCVLVTYDKDLQKVAHCLKIRVTDPDGNLIHNSQDVTQGSACFACKSVYVKYNRQFCKNCGNSGIRTIPLYQKEGGFAIPQQYFKHPPVIRGTNFNCLPKDAHKYLWIREDQPMGDRMRKHNAAIRKYEKDCALLKNSDSLEYLDIDNMILNKPVMTPGVGKWNPNDISDNAKLINFIKSKRR